jgi:surfactin synthase thioesterase subunit
MLPIIRSDFAVLEDPSRQSRRTIKSALLALGGADDHSVPLGALDAWQARTTGLFGGS